MSKDAVNKDSYFFTSGVTVAQFQEKLRAQPWWTTQGLENDKMRLMEPDSAWLRNFMCWSGKEDELLGKIDRVLKWRQKVDIYTWTASDISKAFETPFLQLHGRDQEGTRVLWKVVKYSNSKLIEEGKKAIAYYFEALQRAEPDAKLTIVFNLQGAGMAQSNIDYLKHFTFLLTEAYPNLVKQLVILDLPWVLKSVWAIVKLWLDEKQKSIIHFVDEKGLEAKVPKSAWTEELKGQHKHKFEGTQIQLPEDFADKKFAKSLAA